VTRYTCGSLFTGIGGIDYAFSCAGFDVLFQCEIDDYCRKVLSKHAEIYWPVATQFTDVRTIGGHNLPAVDVLFGGFPCQDVSLAGKRAGISESTRSGLWLEFARIIGDIRPRVVLLENVAGILTRDGSLVIADLAKMGYVGHWGVIRASDSGAPHQRERWFCVAYAAIMQCDGGNYNTSDGMGFKSLSELGNGNRSKPVAYPSSAGRQERDIAAVPNRTRHGTRRNITPMGNTTSIRRKQYQPITRSLRTRKAKRRLFKLAGTGHGKSEPGMGRIPDGLSARLDRHQFPARPGQPQFQDEPPRVSPPSNHRAKRLKALGNAVVPQVIYPIALAIREWLEAQEANHDQT